MEVELMAVQARDQDPELALPTRMRKRRVADVVVEVDVALLAHQRQAVSDQRSLDQPQVPRRRDLLRRAHALELALQVIRRRVRGERELEQPADVHRRVARLERKPSQVQWGYLLERHAATSSVLPVRVASLPPRGGRAAID